MRLHTLIGAAALLLIPILYTGCGEDEEKSKSEKTEEQKEEKSEKSKSE